jgi:hypothetical protein
VSGEYAPLAQAVPTGGAAGQVLTPSGWATPAGGETVVTW